MRRPRDPLSPLAPSAPSHRFRRIFGRKPVGIDDSARVVRVVGAGKHAVRILGMSASLPNPVLPARRQRCAFAHPGTNGYLSTWGQPQAGVEPPR